ncbi:putative Ferriportin iron efflux transporter, partial [Aureobasidium melanogenum]
MSNSSLPSYHVRSKLYISHFLSTWNSRLFEFGAVLFISTIFPGTLFPASIYALTRSASVVVFSTFIGHLVDRSERMHLIRLSIIGQRAATAASCILLWLLLNSGYTSLDSWSAKLALVFLSFLACMEKLSSVVNTISIERDWVVVISQKNTDDLQELNSQMRRIDLFCKLIGPLSIALIAGVSTNVAILVTFGMTAVSVFVEYYAIARVYYEVEDLQLRSEPFQDSQPTDGPVASPAVGSHAHHSFRSCISYIQHPAFLPSFSLSLLYLTVLTFGGQMVTYLLSVGFSSISIGLLRTVSTIFELSTTWLAPKAMHKIGAIRCGIWFLNWQIIWDVIAVTMLWIEVPQKYAVLGLLAGTIASRVGLWGFDLSAQVIVQEAVESDQRGSFSAMEASVQNTFELLSFASTTIFARPDQFKIPAAISAAAVVLAGLMYAFFVRQRRGHLFHASKCMQRKGRPTWQSLAQDEEVELS